MTQKASQKNQYFPQSLAKINKTMRMHRTQQSRINKEFNALPSPQTKNTKKSSSRFKDRQLIKRANPDRSFEAASQRSH